MTPFFLSSALDGECILFWQDFNQFMQLDTIRRQKIDRNGEKLWGEKPVIVDSAGQLATPLGIGKLNDGTGGAFFAYRGNNTTKLVYIDRQGITRFNKIVGNFDGTGWNLQECMAATHGKGVFYTIFRRNEGSFACAIDATGQELWPEVLYTTRQKVADWNGLVSDGNGGAILAWHEILPLRGIWTQQVSGTGQLGVVTSVKDFTDQHTLTKSFHLFPAYPNPFTGTVSIVYQLLRSEMVRIKIYDLSGKEVATLLEQQQALVKHEVIWDGRDQYGHSVSSGVYFYQLTTGAQRQWCKLILLR